MRSDGRRCNVRSDERKYNVRSLYDESLGGPMM